MVKVPAVFISSTFYDLRQVRANISDFVEALGYRFLASEHPSFPVDPSLTTIENCRRRVEDEADIFVLVVGARYGSTVPGGVRSVTNVEYLTARSKGLPVYAFITRELLTCLRILEQNPAADLSGSVDSPKLFDFVRDLRGSDGVWTFEFDLAQEIVSTLRLQLAYQMSRGLDMLRRIRAADEATRELRGEPLRLVLEKPNGWVPSLFVTLVENELAAAADERRDHELGITVGTGERLSDEAVPGWASSMCREATRLVDGMMKLTSTSLNEALANGDPASIIFATKHVGRIYREALSWSARVRRAHVPKRWRIAIAELATMMNDFLQECDAFVPRMRSQLQQALDAPGEGSILLEFKFRFSIPDMSKMHAELQKLQ